MFLVPTDEMHDHPVRTFTRLAQECPELLHLSEHEVTVDFLFRTFDQVDAGRRVLGSVHLPAVQGKLSKLFLWMLEERMGRIPDFLIILDHSWWDAATSHLREILIFHEMCHCVIKKDKWGEPMFNKETGAPVWALQGHDVEEFNATVERYGAWQPHIAEFIAAAERHREGG